MGEDGLYLNQKQERGDDLNVFQDEEQLVKPVENGDGEEEATVKRNTNNYRRLFSVCAMSLLVSYIIVLVFRAVTDYLSQQHPGGLLSGSNDMNLLVSSAIMYLIGMPAAYLIMRIIPKQKIRRKKLSLSRFFAILSVSFLVVLIGNMAGNTLSALLTAGNAENSVVSIASQSSIITTIILTIAAPVFEELVFRKAMLDRLVCCGEKWALIFTALCFAMYHMNLFQFFYAFGVGIVFGYTYLRTGKVIYNILLHVFVNLMGGVIAPLAVSALDTEGIAKLFELIGANAPVPDELLQSVLPGLLGFIVYNLVLYGLGAAGIIIFILRFRKIRFVKRENEPEAAAGISAMLLNAGMILFIAFSVAFTSKNLFS